MELVKPRQQAKGPSVACRNPHSLGTLKIWAGCMWKLMLRPRCGRREAEGSDWALGPGSGVQRQVKGASVTTRGPTQPCQPAVEGSRQLGAPGCSSYT